MVPMRAHSSSVAAPGEPCSLRGLASATFFSLLVIGLLAGCGSGGGSSGGGGTTAPASVTQVVGSAGGTVSLPDGNAVTISSGMLKDDTKVTVSTASSPAVPLGELEDPVSSGIRVEIPAGSLSESPSPTAGIALTYTPSLSSSASVGSLTSQAALTSDAYNLLRITISRGVNSIVTYGPKALDAAGKVVMWVPRTYLEAVKIEGDIIGSVLFDMRETYVGRCFVSDSFGKIFQVLDPGTFTTDNFVTSPTRVPLVLVHGIQLLPIPEKCIGAYKDTWATFITQYFQDSGLGELKNKFLLYTFSYDSSKDISENGRLLTEELKKIPGAPSVVVLAHSMGGLVARSALANHSANIRGLVSLDTPHHGTLRFRTRDVWRAISDVAITGVVGQGITTALLDPQGAKQLDWDNFDNKVSACTPTCNQFLLDLWAKDQQDSNLNKYVAFASKAQEPSSSLAVPRELIYLIASKLGIPLDNDGIVPVVSALFSEKDYSQQPLRWQKTLDLPDHLAILESPAIDDPDIRAALLGFLQAPPPPPPPSTFTLAVAKQGTGTGTVTSNLSGIVCGAVCQFGFPVGQQVVLSQVAGSGSTFAGWGGACTGIGPCIVTMTANQNVTATFNLVSPPPPPTYQGTWSPAGSLTTGRYAHTATLLQNGKVLVVGGGSASSILASAELYDPATGSWTLTGSLATWRDGHTATLLPNGKVLVAGGSFFPSAELYDPATGIWTPTGSLATARSAATATLFPNGKVLVVGGFSNNVSLSSAELYDPATGNWTLTGNLATVRGSHTATLLSNGKVLVAGGVNTSSFSYLASAELYDPATGAWTPTGSLATARQYHTATLLPNGKVVVAAGGKFQGSDILASAELYDPATGIWTPTGSLAIARLSPTATLLANDKILLAGGLNNGSGFLANAELYDPTTGIWTPTGSLATARSAATATLLPNGKVLVAGGVGGENSSGVLASAELFQ